MKKLENIFELILGLIVFSIIMVFLLLFGGVLGVIIGAILQATLAPWLFWPGFILGEIIFIVSFWHNFLYSTETPNTRTDSSFAAYRRIKLIRNLTK
ncbi:hypothetical protein SAMN02745221_01933 [Thermosyntropha lipolytica DSM 11003]|uniref:Uncharacterized protein n=1 Tax=Thermosyntropha lipolytica DSM 11003 TaxID=1123382 RepID=A0A1M5R498_9FIRM|nr:hypothetical protein [Thermosyntropha lipolytica]SHH21214.1 hypothetical protein SAMN02745221_01933 [Thermosyntropha lipolytica DSM 11003]